MRTHHAGTVCVILILSWATHTMFAGEVEEELSAKETFHLFLLAGQSNMAGRGKIAEEDQKPHPRVLALSKDGQWRPAVDPIHFDKNVAGVGLGKSFAIVLAEQDPNVTIGLIPAACGGSPIESWTPGGYHGQTKSNPYDNALRRARRGMEDGVLKGILWHQGESDCKADRADVYQARLEQLIARFRTDLKQPGLPFLIGQLGQFPQRPWDEQRRKVNQAHVSIAEAYDTVSFVSSDGLTCKSDHVHFDAKSLRDFGRRYAKLYEELIP